MGPIMTYLQTVLPDDAIVTNGAGNYATWIHRFHRFRRFGTQAAPTGIAHGAGRRVDLRIVILAVPSRAIARIADPCKRIQLREER